MPFIPDDDLEPVFDRLILDDPEGGAQTEEPSWTDKARAAFSVDNSIGSLITREKGLPDVHFQGGGTYDPWSAMSDDEKLDENFTYEAAFAESDQELDALRAQISKEQKARAMQTGVSGTLMAIGAGIFDPINLIPVGGTAYRTYRTGGSVLRNGLATASAGATGAGLAESALHATQIERTYGESAANMAAGAFIGGALGLAAGSMAKSQADTLLRDVADSLDLDKPNAFTGPHSVGAAEAWNEIKIKGTAAEKFAKLVPFDPMTRILTKASQKAKQVLVQLAENPYDVEGFTGQAVESAAKVRRDALLYRGMRGHRDAFKEYKAAGGELNHGDFNIAVARELRNEAIDTHPAIKKSAAAWRKEVYDPQAAASREVKLLGEDTEVTTAQNYLNRVWNKEKVAAEMPEFENRVTKWLEEQEVKRGDVQSEVTTQFDAYSAAELNRTEYVSRIEALSDEISRNEAKMIEARLAKNASREAQLTSRIDDLKSRTKDLEAKINDSQATIDDLTARLEQRVADWPGKSGDEVRRALKDRSEGGKVKLTKPLRKAIEKIVKAEVQRDANELRSLARQIGGRIMGTPDGMLPYDYKIGSSVGAVPGKSEVAGAFKARSFNIPDHLVEDFLDNDIEKLAGKYLRQTSTDIEIMRKFGGEEGQTPDEVLSFVNQRKEIDSEYADLIAEAKTAKERIKLNKERNSVLKDLQGVIDRMRGQYEIPDQFSILSRIGAAARNINFMRMMGGVTLSSIPDAARIIMAEGFTRAFGSTFRPLIRGLKAAKLSGDDVRYMGIGTDAITSGRMEVISDINDYALGGSKFERGLQAMANSFGKINLMNQWTSLMKVSHAVSMQTRVMDDLIKGKVDTRLQRLGLSSRDMRAIAAEVRVHGQKDAGAWIYNSKSWDDQALAFKWAQAMKKESDRVILVPGQEKPLFMSRETGKLFLQFKSFMMVATQRITIAALQGQDAHVAQGLLFMVGLGAMTYAIKQIEAGRPVSDDPAQWVIEGIDRSGALGILMEVNNTMEKVSSNHFGLRPLLGVSTGSSRYSTRSVSESVLGPTMGSLLDTTVRVANAVSSEYEWTDKDTSALRRLLPYQNLVGVRTALNKIEEALK